MSFRQKILLSQFLLLLALITILLPLLERVTTLVLRNIYQERVMNLVDVLEKTKDQQEMIHIIDAHINHVKKAFNTTVVLICVGLLVINGMLIMALVHRVMRPVQQIIDAIRPYKEGKDEFLPRIYLKEPVQADEFTKLAVTINSLTDQIQKQISFLTRQKEETEEILESIGEGIIAADPSARVIFANTAACRMLGVMQEQILKKSLDSIEGISSDLLKKSHELVVHALQTAEPLTYTWVVRNKGTFYHELISAPLAHKDGALLVLQDKTSDYRIVELGKDFIANASHELKTPITIIRGFAETLQDLPEISHEMLQEITEKIVKTCIRLDKLVKSLLTLTDIEHLTEEHFEKIDLSVLVENCKNILLAVHPSAKVRIHSDMIRAFVAADPDLLNLAVMNILENAVKYSREPAVIDISIEQMLNAIYLKIKDQGIGISEEDLPQIFERFFTVDKARSRKKGGAGLGLSIVKTVIEKHRGKVLASSELGKGSAFTLILPVFGK